MRTCELRGWATVLHSNIPISRLSTEDLVDQSGANLTFGERGQIFRLTEAGWAALNRTHAWLLATFAVASATLVATVLSVWLTWWLSGGKLP